MEKFPFVLTIAAVSIKYLANAGKIERNVSRFSIFACRRSGLEVDLDQYPETAPGVT
jgi:hypothetical protein